LNIFAGARSEPRTVCGVAGNTTTFLAQCGIPVSYTNVFWGGHSEIKPSGIAPAAYRQWCASVGLDLDGK
jgi:hypothetical protein